MTNKILRGYTNFVTRFPFIVLILSILLSGIAIHYSSQVGQEDMNPQNMLPDGVEVIEAFDLVEEKFGSSKSFMVAIETEPVEKGIVDVRDPDAVKYTYTLSQKLKHLQDVKGVSSAGTLYYNYHDEKLPNSLNQVQQFSRNNFEMKRYINNDYSMSLVRVNVVENFEPSSIIPQVHSILDNTEKPPGLKGSIAGSDVADEVVNKKLGPDMQRTSQISLIGILVVLFLIFRSFFYGVLPLFTIIFGIMWAFGYIGLRGMNMSSGTSGVVSMIMGIGIDFGIQTIMRFKQETKYKVPATAMRDTLDSVLIPMSITTIAAIIGFKAMTLGNLTFLADMGNMMAYGVFFCFIAAVTVVPALVLLYEEYMPKNIINKLLNKNKVSNK